MKFINLHAHSLSIFDAIGYPEEHYRFAQEGGMDAMAITDHGHMNALPYQIEAAKKLTQEGKKFNARFGSEVYFIESIEGWRSLKEEHDKNKKSKKDDEISGALVENEGETKAQQSLLNRRSHLVLLAQNQEGLSNIFKLISDSYKPENFYRYPRMDFDALKAHSKGLIAFSACLGGVLAAELWAARDESDDVVYEYMKAKTKKFQAIFGDRFYGEIQFNSIPEQHRLNKLIFRLHYDPEIKLPIVATADSHYPTADSWKDRELYKRLGWLSKGRPSWATESELPQGVEELGYELYPKNGDQMWESYKKYCKDYDFYDDNLVREAIEVTDKIAHELMEDFLPDTSVKLPGFVVPPGESPETILRKMAFEGLRSKNLQENETYVARLDRELNVIEKRGFTLYFLTMKTIVDIASETQITGPARGSAGGALLSYLLGITKVDPIRWGLQFERFMTEDESGGFADIDLDVTHAMDLKDELIRRWGDTSVVPISNWNTLQFKSLIKDVSKFYGIPFTDVNIVTKNMVIEATPKAKAANDIKFGVYNPTFEEFKQYSTSLQEFFQKYPLVAEHIENLHGSLRSNGRHASGVIIAENLDYKMPLINSGGVRQTPWSEGNNVRHLEPLGFIKFDLLGLETLSIIAECVRKILIKEGNPTPSFAQIKEYYDTKLHPDKIDFNDQVVWKNIFHDGKFPSIFQLTEKNVQEFCKKVKPTSIEDLAAVTAIWRPGALSSGVPEKYLEARLDPSSVTHPHPLIAEILKDTHFMIYQEHIASIASAMGKDISLADGNMLRKVLTKKGTGKTEKVKKQLYQKFVDGCVEKGLTPLQAEDIWTAMGFYSGYGFNKSHSVAYSIISYVCAYLFNYHPDEWLASYLDTETEANKATALSLVQSFGYKIKSLDINQSGMKWSISSTEPKTLIQPLLSIKGLGEAAIDQIVSNRPFTTIESLLFNENIKYTKLNKKCLDVLFRAGAVNDLIDYRFNGLKHAWSACVVDRPRDIKKLNENIEAYSPEGDFTPEENVVNVFELTGNFPLDKIVDERTKQLLAGKFVQPISEYDEELEWVWGVPINATFKQTQKGADYLIVDLIDSNFVKTSVRCWGVNKKYDNISLYSLYMLRPKYSGEWGFSSNGRLSNAWKLISKPKK